MFYLTFTVLLPRDTDRDGGGGNDGDDGEKKNATLIIPVFDQAEAEFVILPNTTKERKIETTVRVIEGTVLTVRFTSWNGSQARGDVICVGESTDEDEYEVGVGKIVPRSKVGVAYS